MENISSISAMNDANVYTFLAISKKKQIAFINIAMKYNNHCGCSFSGEKHRNINSVNTAKIFIIISLIFNKKS